MTRLSVNINKIATLRNARGENRPDLLQVAQNILQYGVHGLTVHPRPDRRHILYEDVYVLSSLFHQNTTAEFNVEGYPSPSFLELIETIKPHQCTLVPDPPHVLTSNAGWNLRANQENLKPVLNALKKWKVRSSLFIDPYEFNAFELEILKKLSPDRVELYTKSYADDPSCLNTYVRTSHQILPYNIQINAGHDLNQKNLKSLIQAIPQIKEVSIGHDLICESLYEGLEKTISKYLEILQKAHIIKNGPFIL